MFTFAALVFAALSLVLVGRPAASGEITTVQWHGHNVLKLSGEINEGTVEAFEAQSSKVEPLPYGLPVLLLDSPGGLVDKAMKISDLLDGKAFHTVVPDGAKCASACASVVFIAGRARTVEDGGLLGQHSCSRAGVPDPDCNEKLSANAVGHGVSYGSISAFVTYVSPEKIMWFSREDAESWGLTKYPGEDWSGFEKSEPRVIKVITGKMPPAQTAWRVDFRDDGYEAFLRPASDFEHEGQLDVFCDEKAKGHLMLGLEVSGQTEVVRSAVLEASVLTDVGSWKDATPTIRQREFGITEVITDIPANDIKMFLTKADKLQVTVSLRDPYKPIVIWTRLDNSRKVILFAANHCVGGQ